MILPMTTDDCPICYARWEETCLARADEVCPQPWRPKGPRPPRPKAKGQVEEQEAGMSQDFDEVLGKLISELASRPVDIDRRRVRWCLDRGISPFAWCADGGCEAWQLVSDEALGDEISPPANSPKSAF